MLEMMCQLDPEQLELLMAVRHLGPEQLGLGTNHLELDKLVLVMMCRLELQQLELLTADTLVLGMMYRLELLELLAVVEHLKLVD